MQVRNLCKFFVFLTHLVRCAQLEHLDVTYREWITCLSSNSYKFLKRVCQEHSFTAGQGFPQQWRLPKGSTMQQFAKVAESCRWFHSPLQSMGASCSVSGWEQVSSCAWLQIWTVSDSYIQCQSKGGANHPDPSGWWKRWPHAKRHFQTSY